MPRRIWLCADYSQAEARVVAWAGPVPTLRDLFQRGDDVHLYVARHIAKHIQDNHIQMPEVPMPLADGTTVKQRIFAWKPWDQLTADDHERYVSKRTVHANNYGMGKTKFAVITGLPISTAETVQKIYFILFPEVQTGYQAWIDSLLNSRTRTIVVPQGFRRVFYDAAGPELSRAGYAFYPQTTVGLLLVDTLTEVCEVFAKDLGQTWITNPIDPDVLLRAGYNVRLQMHDSLAIALDEDPGLIADVATTVKNIGERPLVIRNPKDQIDMLSIPMDFKVGYTIKEKQPWEDDHPDYLRKYVIPR